MPEIQNSDREKKKSFDFLSNASFTIWGICVFDATWDIRNQSHTRDSTDHP